MAPSSSKTASSAKERVRKHRAALRAAGLRPIQIWVPDIRRPGFQEEIDRQCRALNGDPQEKEVLDFIERAMDLLRMGLKRLEQAWTIKEFS